VTIKDSGRLNVKDAQRRRIPLWPGFILAVLVAMSAAGCEFLGQRALPSNPEWRGGCSIGVGRDATLRGSASDDRVTWAVDNGMGVRVELLWPVGYTARFSPQLEVLDEEGRVVAHEGDQVIGSCLTQEEDGGAIRIDSNEIRPAGWQPGDG
jgi:hypothetical protein